MVYVFTKKCNKKMIHCPQWCLSALIMLFRLFKCSSAHFLTGSTCFLIGYQSHPWKALYYKPQTPYTKHPYAKAQLKTPNHNEEENMRIKYKTLAKNFVASLSCISIEVSGEPKISGLSLLL